MKAILLRRQTLWIKMWMYLNDLNQLVSKFVFFLDSFYGFYYDLASARGIAFAGTYLLER